MCVSVDYFNYHFQNISEQVNYSEIGALQGAADTIRTLSNAVGNPLMSEIFAYCIRYGEFNNFLQKKKKTTKKLQFSS